MCFLYILRTSLNRVYIGVTENLDERIAAHKSGKGADWTRTHRGARLVYSEPHLTFGAARKRELQLKKWSRAKKGSTHCTKFGVVEGFESVQIQLLKEQNVDFGRS